MYEAETVGDYVFAAIGVVPLVGDAAKKMHTAQKAYEKAKEAGNVAEMVKQTENVANLIKEDKIRKGVGGNAGKGTTATTGKQEAIIPNNNWGALDNASKTAFDAAKNNVTTWTPKDKHMVGTIANRSAQFNTNNVSDIQNLVKEALNSPNAKFIPNNVDGSFRVVVDMNKPIGTKGQTSIRIIIGNDRKIWNAFPVNSQ
ncbi:hypothetical protein [Snodgrassella alvi]|uniref:hypothetical protein n=1 Tax=Snodgrassella alvi TaxID=1196083 RepID=UPI003516513D